MIEDTTTYLGTTLFHNYYDGDGIKWIVPSDINEALNQYKSIAMDIDTWERNKGKITHNNVRYRIGKISGKVGVWIPKPLPPQ